MTWWCSAQGAPWSGVWQAYPGVWLFLAILVLGRWWLMRRFPPGSGERRGSGVFALAIAALWIALDWPVGALGAGYLLSAHQLQYVLVVMVAAPLLLLGVPRASLRRVVDGPRVHAVLSVVTRPAVAIIACNAIVILTHLPEAVDGLMTTQWGSMIIDLSWLFAGFLLWWPALSPVPGLNALSHGARFGYLLVATLIPGIPAAFFFFASYPLYQVYELAPPVNWLNAMDDQFLAGIIMKFGSFVVVLVGLSAIFYRWHAHDRGTEGTLVLPRPLGESNPR